MDKHFFATYTVRELQRLGYWDYDEARQTNLTYPIHPLLERSVWSCPDSLYRGITHILRLASAMLQCPASIAFHHALMFGTREYLLETSQRHGYPCQRLCHTDHDEVTARRDVDTVMLRIARRMVIRFFKASDPGFTHLTAFAVTRRNAATPTFLRDVTQQSGTGSVIHINYHYIENLSKGNMPLSQLLRLQFYMALTISHEIAHAVNNAVSMQVYEPFYEDQRLSEVGRAWENEVFGGMTEMIYETDARNPLAFAKWPTYADKPAPKNGVLDLRGPKRYTTWYFVSMKWITDIQQQWFWDVAGDTTKLRIPKRIGFQKKYGYQDYDRDWDQRSSSEGRWPGDSRGRVYREEIDENWDEDVVAPKDFFDLEADWDDLGM